MLITDFLFPKGDVLGLIEQVRKTKAWDKLPIVVVSASRDRMLVSRVLKAGANEALCKPLIPEEFRQLIKCMLSSPIFVSPEPRSMGSPAFNGARAAASTSIVPS